MKLPPAPVPTAQFTPSLRPWKNGAITEKRDAAHRPQPLVVHKRSVPEHQIHTFTTTNYQRLNTLIGRGLPIQETKKFFTDLFQYNELDSRKVFTEFSKRTKNTLFCRKKDGSYGFQGRESRSKGYAALNIFIDILGHKTDPDERNELGYLLAELIKHTMPGITQTYDGDGDLPLHAFCKLLLETPLSDDVSQSVLKSFYEHKSVNGGIHLFCQKIAPTKQPDGAKERPESIVDILSEPHEDYAASASNRGAVLKHLLEHLGRDNTTRLLGESGYASPEKVRSLADTHPGTPILKAAVRALYPFQNETRISNRDGSIFLYVTIAIWTGIRSRFYFGMGIYPQTSASGVPRVAPLSITDRLTPPTPQAVEDQPSAKKSRH